MEDLNGVANRSQRIAKFVRQCRQELVLAAIGFAQRLRALLYALLKAVIQQAEPLLDTAPLDHLVEQSAIGQSNLSALAIEVSEDGDLRTENDRIHRLVKIIHGTAAIACTC